MFKVHLVVEYSYIHSCSLLLAIQEGLVISIWDNILSLILVLEVVKNITSAALC